MDILDRFGEGQLDKPYKVANEIKNIGQKRLLQIRYLNGHGGNRANRTNQPIRTNWPAKPDKIDKSPFSRQLLTQFWINRTNRTNTGQNGH